MLFCSARLVRFSHHHLWGSHCGEIQSAATFQVLCKTRFGAESHQLLKHPISKVCCGVQCFLRVPAAPQIGFEVLDFTTNHQTTEDLQWERFSDWGTQAAVVPKQVQNSMELDLKASCKVWGVFSLSFRIRGTFHCKKWGSIFSSLQSLLSLQG